MVHITLYLLLLLRLALLKFFQRENTNHHLTHKWKSGHSLSHCLVPFLLHLNEESKLILIGSTCSNMKSLECIDVNVLIQHLYAMRYSRLKQEHSPLLEVSYVKKDLFCFKVLLDKSFGCIFCSFTILLVGRISIP